MKKDNFGTLIILINIVLSLFLLTMKEEKLTYFIVCIISNIIAIIFSIFILLGAEVFTPLPALGKVFSSLFFCYTS